MSPTDFAKFVEDQQPTAIEETIDWDAIREQWLADLRDLYTQLTGFLKEYIDSGKISVSHEPKTLTEGDLGTYPVDKLVLSIGRQRVTLDPQGTMLIGSKGRVDVHGASGDALLLLVGEDVRSSRDLHKVSLNFNGKVPEPSQTQPNRTWKWKIATRTPNLSFTELDASSFYRLLMEVANG